MVGPDGVSDSEDRGEGKGMSENLKIWDALKQPPESALKRITGGRLNGKTDINPQWRMQAMTERFGPVGTGWKYELVRFWTEPGSEGQIMAFAEIKLYYRRKSKEWSDAIPGVGGSMLVEKESRGLHSSDEAFKMATTDALSVAMKSLGVAADIYRGLWDGNKYLAMEEDDVLTFADAVTYAQMIAAAQKCADKETLKAFYQSEINRLGSDNIGRAVLVKVVEMKRAELKAGQHGTA